MAARQAGLESVVELVLGGHLPLFATSPMNMLGMQGCPAVCRDIGDFSREFLPPKAREPNIGHVLRFGIG